VKATAEGVLIPWDELPELLRCVNYGMHFNADGMERNQRKRKENRSEAIIEIWKKDYNLCVKVGDALVDAYKEYHPDANVQYAKVVE
jgi:hypothetical protein